MTFKALPGVFDTVPRGSKEAWRQSHLWSFLEKVMQETARDFGYEEIRTPIFERTELFQRTVGTDTDIVSKEMYSFEDRGGRNVSLRPEGTAPVMRAFIENHLQNLGSTHKLFYIGPMFRHERSQAGRYRQHHQFGAEAIGTHSPEQDAEIIDLLYTTFKRLSINGLEITLNCLGDQESRSCYRKALKSYLEQHRNALSEDSQKRFETNPLRILDSKDANDQAIIQKGPIILDFLDDAEKTHFETVQRRLEQINIPFVVNPHLVRGLDYYTSTVFEVIAKELGAQNSIGGGGRYDGLLKSLGGPDLPAIGFGAGLERILQTLLKQNVETPQAPHPTLFLIPLGTDAVNLASSLLHELRTQGISTQMDFSGRKLNKVMQYANQIGARYVSVIGDAELEKKELTLKEMESGTTSSIPINELTKTLKKW